MRIGLYLSSLGGSPLEVGLRRGLQELGHEVGDHVEHDNYDIVLAFNQSSHIKTYEFRPFPTNYERLAFIDTAEYGRFSRLPDVVHKFWNGFAEGSISHDTKNMDEQVKLHGMMKGRSFPYFIREYMKQLSYPSTYHPIDYPLYAHSKCNIAPNRFNFKHRSKDLYISWGVSHPLRRDISESLHNFSGGKVIRLVNDPGVPRLPHPEYFKNLENSICSISFDGYGSGSFRTTECLVRCLLFVGPSGMQTRMPLIDGETCISYDVVADGDGDHFISTDILERMNETLKDKDRCFDIYENGFHHCMNHYTEKATSQYVLDVIDKHDYSVPTPIDQLEPAL